MRDIDNISSLISSLPLSDIKIGNRFLKERNFSELQLLVDSAIVKIKHNLSSNLPKEEYKSIDLESLEKLSMLVSNYRDQLVENFQQEEDEFEDELNLIDEDLMESLI